MARKKKKKKLSAGLEGVAGVIPGAQFLFSGAKLLKGLFGKKKRKKKKSRRESQGYSSQETAPSYTAGLPPVRSYEPSPPQWQPEQRYAQPPGQNPAAYYNQPHPAYQEASLASVEENVLELPPYEAPP